MKHMKRIGSALCILIAFVFVAPIVAPDSIIPETSTSTVYAALKIKLNKKTATIKVGKTVQLKVKGTKKKVKWTSSSKKIASVSSKGKVKGKKAGIATITAKVGNKKLKCKVTVKKPSKSIFTVDKTQVVIADENPAVVMVKISYGKEISCKTSNSAVATCEFGDDGIPDNGFARLPLYITGVKNGTAYVTVITDNNVKKTIKVIVDRQFGSLKISKTPPFQVTTWYGNGWIETDITDISYEIEYLEYTKQMQIKITYTGVNTNRFNIDYRRAVIPQKLCKNGVVVKTRDCICPDVELNEPFTTTSEIYLDYGDYELKFN